MCSSPANPRARLLQGLVVQWLLGETLSLLMGLEGVKILDLSKITFHSLFCFSVGGG